MTTEKFALKESDRERRLSLRHDTNALDVAGS